jgi:phosphopantetheinyl transferase
VLPAAGSGAPLALSDGEVHVWSFAIGEADRGARRQLARERRAEILAAYLGVPVDAVRLSELDGGKPVLSDRALEFNLSHSGAFALLAVSRELPVGVDVEARRDSIDLVKGIRDRCTAREGEHVMTATDPSAAWVRLWTRKEAVVKATGAGVLDQLGSIDVLDEVVIGHDGALDGSWRCLDLDPPARGFHAALSLPNVAGIRILMRQRP